METLPTPADDSWGQDDNPRRYDAFAREYPSYRETSRDLIDVVLPSADAGVADAAVLDLACGTGATTREILAVLGPDGRVTGVDKSAAMLGVAASSTTDTRATWIQARAERVDQHVTERVDAVICNSAIWQTDLAATAMAVRAVMKAGGRFAFNVPVDFLDEDGSHRSRERYPSLLSEMRAIAAHDYGWAPHDRAPGLVRQRPTQESICRSVAAAGFDVEQVTEVSHQDSAESQRAWLSIPIFTRDLLGDLPYKDRMRVLDKVYERLGPGQTEREVQAQATATTEQLLDLRRVAVSARPVPLLVPLRMAVITRPRQRHRERPRGARASVPAASAKIGIDTVTAPANASVICICQPCCSQLEAVKRSQVHPVRINGHIDVTAGPRALGSF